MPLAKVHAGVISHNPFHTVELEFVADNPECLIGLNNLHIYERQRVRDCAV